MFPFVVVCDPDLFDFVFRKPLLMGSTVCVYDISVLTKTQGFHWIHSSSFDNIHLQIETQAWMIRLHPWPVYTKSNFATLNWKLQHLWYMILNVELCPTHSPFNVKSCVVLVSHLICAVDVSVICDIEYFNWIMGAVTCSQFITLMAMFPPKKGHKGWT